MAKEIFKGKDGQHYFRIKADNGQIVLQSEGYKTKAGAEKGVESVEKHGRSKENFEIKDTRNGKKYFVLKAANGRTIGKSQMYVSKTGASKGIESVKTNSRKKC